MDLQEYENFKQATAYEHTESNHAQHHTQYSTTFQEEHPVQTELVSWLQKHRAKTGIIGKRSTIERDDFDQPSAQGTTERRKVVVKYKENKI